MDWKEKVCIITGSTSGIGTEAALAIANKGIKLVLPVRDITKAVALKQEILEKTGNSQVDIFECDLSSMDDIHKFAADFQLKYSRLHILINNAGLWETSRKESRDGIELTFAVNHLATFLLTNLLLGVMKRSAPARIINTSSMAHIMAEMKFNDLEGKKHWSGFKSYAMSKLAAILFTRKLARMLEGKEITVNSLHPGVIYTNLYRRMPSFLVSFMRLLLKSPREGAQTTIFLALSPEVENVTGGYFVNCKLKKPSKKALDDAAADRLWEVSCQYAKLPENPPAYGKSA